MRLIATLVYFCVFFASNGFSYGNPELERKLPELEPKAPELEPKAPEQIDDQNAFDVDRTWSGSFSTSDNEIRITVTNVSQTSRPACILSGSILGSETVESDSGKGKGLKMQLASTLSKNQIQLVWPTKKRENLLLGHQMMQLEYTPPKDVNIDEIDFVELVITEVSLPCGNQKFSGRTLVIHCVRSGKAK